MGRWLSLLSLLLRSVRLLLLHRLLLGVALGRGAQVRPRHGRGHLQVPLPKVPPEAEKARGEQQAKAAGHVDHQEREDVAPGARIAYEQMSDSKQRQGGKREVDDPKARRVRA